MFIVHLGSFSNFLDFWDLLLMRNPYCVYLKIYECVCCAFETRSLVKISTVFLIQEVL